MHHCHAISGANGPLTARVLFIAEAPGRRGAAITGVPLTRDAAGARFEALLAHAGIARSDVFVTNAVLCNPLDAHGRNRRPSASEIARCRPFLTRTLDVVDAPLVVALGRVALDALGTVEPHGLDLRRDVASPCSWRGRTLIALYHPGRQALLHRADVLQRDDWRRLGAFVRGFVPGDAPSYHVAG